MPIKYISHIPNTVEGQAILDNFVRTRRILRYRDNDKVFDRVKRGLPLFEVEKVEEVRLTTKSTENSQSTLLSEPCENISVPCGKNLLIRGECLSACAYLKDKGIKVDLVYIDPPFASGADYAKKVYIRRNPKLAEKIAKAEEQLDIEELRSFEEKMYGDIWNKEDYLNWMYENLVAIKSIMSDTASIYVHLDWHIGHYVKILMDEVFGEDKFRNEIVWCYNGPSVVKNAFPRKHDTIYFYAKNDENVFNGAYVPHKSGLHNTGQVFGDMENENIERVKELMERGKMIEDWWADLFPVDRVRSEMLDYSTQKPEALLERIIKASSNEGMLVADFFGGSGVTAKVSNDLKRNFIHVDVGVNSIQTTRDRLIQSMQHSALSENLGVLSGKKELTTKLTKNSQGTQGFDILDVKDGVSLFRNPVQTMDKLKSLIIGLRNEDGLDNFWEGAINDSKIGLVPVYVPNLLDHSTKVLDIPLINRIINEAIPDLPDNTKQVIVYYIDIDDEKELLKFIDEYNNTDVKIVLRDLKEILDEVVINDIIEFEVKGNEIEFTKFISDRLKQKIDEYNQKKGLNRKKKDLFNGNEENGNGESEDEDNDENGNNEKPEAEEKTKKKKFVPIEISDNGLELIEMISLDCTNTEGMWKSDYEIKIDKNGYLAINGKKSKDFWNGKISFEKKPLRMKVRNIAGDETILNISEKCSNKHF
jgi:adenine-specific DNA-methyltransferase